MKEPPHNPDGLPLAGKRIVLFRDQEKSEASENLIRARGGIPFAMPVLSFASLESAPEAEAALSSLASYDWVFFTSRTGVAKTLEALATRAESVRAFGAAKIAAVGSSTARALGEAGVRIDFVPSVHEGEALALEWCATQSSPRKVLILRARVAREELVRALAKAGHVVDDVAIYETRISADIDPEPLVDADVLLFTSPSTVRGYLSLRAKLEVGLQARNEVGLQAKPEPRDGTSRALVASIGTVTSHALTDAGIRVDVEPDTSTFEDLLAAVEAAFASQRN